MERETADKEGTAVYQPDAYSSMEITLGAIATDADIVRGITILRDTTGSVYMVPCLPSIILLVSGIWVPFLSWELS